MVFWLRLQANFSNKNKYGLEANFNSGTGKFDVTFNASGVVVKDHNALNNRDMENQHPINAITGLKEVVDEVDKLEPTESITNQEIEDILKLFT